MYTPEMPWAVPVRVRLQSGVERSFASVYDALDFLHNEWPTRHGCRYDRAIQQCSDALRRALPSAVAREAFIAACLEAGMSTGSTRRAMRRQPAAAPEQSPAAIDGRFRSLVRIHRVTTTY
ncbi:hypothetical protein J2Y48_004848 [Mycoplana sp. BE70]|uniref:DUF982 domain-containing protein n=1 Tax=Mycoplana sp. BE70 TaxID=2817775 RepID=UPI00285B38BB|nr:DUF982 domain-containing protein [Mycoplana sp. BE70]MDR6759532.1 hypothetical protein [Mycoplana sp. BE70]